jgi:GAF domain-containing protein
MKDIETIYPKDKTELYQVIQSQLKALLENETNLIPNLANTSALLNMAMEDINWVGFYIVKNKELLLGPFQGKPACIHISIGKGVCGKAVEEGKTQLVIDVNQFPGHIACDSASKSEIVVPIRYNNRIVAVLDIDSPIFARFDAIDQVGLEEVAHILEHGCNWDEI